VKREPDIIDGRLAMKERQQLTVELEAMRKAVRKQYSDIMERPDRTIA
jgi:hypothetical protein